MPVNRRQAQKHTEFTGGALPDMDAADTPPRYLCRNPDDTDELLQETCLRADRVWHQRTQSHGCDLAVLTSPGTDLHNTPHDTW